MAAQPIIVATGNQGKFREIREILSGLPVQLSCLRDHWNPVPSIPENGVTFLENASAKAEWVVTRMPDSWVLADDSGLEVDFLHGEPGVRSARFAGPDAGDAENNRKLLSLLAGCPAQGRTARFRCVMVLRMAAESSLTGEGACEGTIGFEVHGSGGFGYDPLFTPRGHTVTFAELGAEIKNRISHRALALADLRLKLSQRLA